MTSPEVKALLAEFRENLVLFYQCLQLAPPYDSVEKALIHLGTRLREYTAEEHQQMAEEETIKWNLHLEAITQSGLNKKHRGIIAGLLDNQEVTFLPESIRYLKEPFLTSK